MKKCFFLIPILLLMSVNIFSQSLAFAKTFFYKIPIDSSYNKILETISKSPSFSNITYVESLGNKNIFGTILTGNLKKNKPDTAFVKLCHFLAGNPDDSASWYTGYEFDLNYYFISQDTALAFLDSLKKIVLKKAPDNRKETDTYYPMKVKSLKVYRYLNTNYEYPALEIAFFDEQLFSKTDKEKIYYGVGIHYSVYN